MRAIVALLLLCVASAQLSNITINVPYLLPESMDFVSGQGYILGSLYYGGCEKVDPNSGNLTNPFLRQGANMNHTSGVQYDTKGGRNRLLLCSVTLPPSAGGPGGVVGGIVSIDLSGGTPTLANFYDTSAVGSGSDRFCNDIIADAAGNIYATDSFGSQVWKITPTGTVSTLIHDARWDDVNFALDGIEMTTDGNLIVSHISHSELWLVTTAAPITATKIQVSGDYTGSSPDGILFGQHGCLYTVGNNKVYRLGSDNNWVNATVVDTVTVNCLGPTAIAWNSDANAYYVSCAHGFDAGPYTIERIAFATPETDQLCRLDSGGTSAGSIAGVSSVLMLELVLAAAWMA